MNIYIFFFFLTQFISNFLYGALNDEITFRLTQLDSTTISQNWLRCDFEKLRAFPIGCTDIQGADKPGEFQYSITQNRPYLSHEYFKNLITGNFDAASIEQYINDYNYFVTSEIDILLPENQQYQPFPSHLKWKVFKDHEIFFRSNINNNDKKELQESIKTFLYYGPRPDPLSLVTIQKVDLSLAKPAKKLSLSSPFLFDYEVFESINKEEKNSITWLDLSNSILCDLNLIFLNQHFPNLHKLSANNTLIKTISQQDITFLKKVSEQDIMSSDQIKEYEDSWFDEDGMMNLYAAHEKRTEGVDQNQVKKVLDYGDEINSYSFVLELNGCVLENPEEFLKLQNNQPNKRYKRSLCINGIKINKVSLLKKMIAQLWHKKEDFLKAFAITIINTFVVRACWITCKRFFARALIGLYALVSFGALSLYFNEIYKKACSINSVGVVFK